MGQDPLERTNNDVRSGRIVIEPDLNFLHPEYRVLSRLGKGGFGAVFEVIDRDHKRFALKVEARRADRGSQLKKEYNICKRLFNSAGSEAIPEGFPLVYEHKEHNKLEYLIMTRLGESLDKIMDRSPGKQLCKSDILMVGIQVVRRLRYLHEKGILHRDMKPNNLVMGWGPNSEKTVHVIDFGLSSIVQDWATYNCDENAHFVGTVYFAPVETLDRKAPSRMGDLESLAYTLLFLFHAKLPWVLRDPETNRKLTYFELGNQRNLIDARELCKGFLELTGFITAIRETQRTSEPDYQHLIDLLEMALERVGSANNRTFSWLESPRRGCSTASTREDCNKKAV